MKIKYPHQASIQDSPSVLSPFFWDSADGRTSLWSHVLPGAFGAMPAMVVAAS
jgi:hypothetical protein